MEPHGNESPEARQGIDTISRIIVACHNRPDLVAPAVTHLRKIYNEFHLPHRFADERTTNVKKLVHDRINQVKAPDAVPFKFTVVMLREVAHILARRFGLALEGKKERVLYTWLEDHWQQLEEPFMLLLDGKIEEVYKGTASEAA
jgi:hypothetical protein